MDEVSQRLESVLEAYEQAAVELRTCKHTALTRVLLLLYHTGWPGTATTKGFLRAGSALQPGVLAAPWASTTSIHLAPGTASQPSALLLWSQLLRTDRALGRWGALV